MAIRFGTQPIVNSKFSSTYSQNSFLPYASIFYILGYLGMTELLEFRRLMHSRMTTGPLGFNALVRYGAIYDIDGLIAYQQVHAQTVCGRAQILSQLIPPRAIAYAYTAAWVWLGGRLPVDFEIISRRRFKTPLFGHVVRSCTRKILASHETMVGTLRITTPARTACDLCLTSPDIDHDNKACDSIERIFEENLATAHDCLNILEECRYWKQLAHAKAYFTYMNHIYS